MPQVPQRCPERQTPTHPLHLSMTLELSSEGLLLGVKPLELVSGQAGRSAGQGDDGRDAVWQREAIDHLAGPGMAAAAGAVRHRFRRGRLVDSGT